MNSGIITITESAADKILDILSEKNNSGHKLRISVRGGGCSGFTYGFDLVTDVEPDDWQHEPLPGIVVLVDGLSAEYLRGATLDYVSQVMESRFVLNNPNSTGSCGCGSSFSA